MGDLADIELGHFYLAHLLKESTEVDSRYFEAGIRRGQEIQKGGWCVQYSILIDDLGEGFSKEQKEIGVSRIRELLEKFRIDVYKLALESEFLHFAPVLLETLRDNYVLTNDGTSYLTLVSQDPFLWAQETLETPKSIKRRFLEQLKAPTVFQGIPSQSQFLVPIHDPRNASRPFGCSLLTAVWYLARLGIDGFASGEVRPSRLINILPIKYLKSEGFAFDLLKISSAARVRKAAERIEYILL